MWTNKIQLHTILWIDLMDIKMSRASGCQYGLSGRNTWKDY